MSTEIIHDSHSLFFRDPFGAAPCSREITLRLAVYSHRVPEKVFLRIWKFGREEKTCMHLYKNIGTEKLYQVQITAPGTPGLLWYYFIVIFNDRICYYGNNAENLGGRGQLYEHEPPSYQITVYKENLKTPDWFKDAVLYQIFADRFHNGCEQGQLLAPKEHCYFYKNWDDRPVYQTDPKTGKVVCHDFFGGNLMGVIEKLSYLKELGINAIYFNPLFEAPSNHKYDTADYKHIDPMFGDNELFRELCLKARKLGINIILDGVFSHTGSDSIYFNKEGHYPSLGAYQSRESPYYSWYKFYDYPDGYECWWDTETLPNVNELEPSYQNFIIYDSNSVLKHWLRMGIMGWRLDVVDELPSQFVKNFRQVMKEIAPDAVLIGEVWEDASNKISYGEQREYFLGDELDSVMNYPWRKIFIDFLLGKKDAYETHRSLMSLYENYPREHFYATMNLVGSHDVPRILSVLGEAPAGEGWSEKQKSAYRLPPEQKKLALARLKLLALIQMTFPGAPCIYYGDEAGMEGFGDPHCRATYPWGNENKGLLHRYKQLISLRHHYPVLKTGEWIPFYAQGDVYGYLRINENGKDCFNRSQEDSTAVILCNRSVTEKTGISVNLGRWCKGTLVDVLDGKRKIAAKDGLLTITLKPLEGKILLQHLNAAGVQRQYERNCGILLHPTSLPSEYGVGDLGQGAYQFIDFLERSGQKIWQVLPLNPPGYGESPYQPLSAFAGNPLLISVDILLEQGLLNRTEIPAIPEFEKQRVDYTRVKAFKEHLFRRAFARFKDRPMPADFIQFTEENAFWLPDYTLFMALKDYFHGAHWINWESSIALAKPEAKKRCRKLLEEEILYYSFLQYVFFQQWACLKQYANGKGIKIIGDIPIYAGHDSSDVWSCRESFKLDAAGLPLAVAGVPPDYFSKSGQLWGNPVYHWKVMAQDDYRWWRQRLKNLFKTVDQVRLDHFRGFAAYWEVPAGEKTAVKGEWITGPGEAFFDALKEDYDGPELPFIAEDLGIITPDVTELKQKYGLPGMKILQFALESLDEKEFLPSKQPENSFIYTGTHDNDTIIGWYKRISRQNSEITDLLEQYFNFDLKAGEQEICRQFVKLAYQSRARSAVIPLQDILGLDNSARMNLPGTVGTNWSWRYEEQDLNEKVSSKLLALARSYDRC